MSREGTYQTKNECASTPQCPGMGMLQTKRMSASTPQCPRRGLSPNKKSMFASTMQYPGVGTLQTKNQCLLPLCNAQGWAISKQKINVCFHYAMPRGGHAPNQKVCLLPIPIRSKKASLFLRFLLFYFFIISIFTLLYVQKHNFYSFSLFICSFGCVYKCSNFVTIYCIPSAHKIRLL